MRRLKRAAALGLLAGGVCAAPAAAFENVNECAPKTRWCHGVFERSGHRIFLDLAGFGLEDSYRLCVRPPKDREHCRTFGLRPNGTGANASSVRFTLNFPHRRHGRYHARWLYDGRQLGHTLAFVIG